MWLAALASFTLSTAAYAQHNHTEHQIEEIIVSSPQNKSKADTALPSNILSDEALRQNAAATLGETLNQQIGVTTASFGPGVGVPVIRGQGGNRVRVLQDGTGVLDVSTISQDHANGVEPLLAERIEVIRGPATLLYGNGAIGGIVNIIDNRIPETVPETLTGAIEQRHNTATSGNTTVFKLDGGAGSFAWHLDGLYRKNDNIEIPGFATAHDDHDEEEAEAEEEENTYGFIDNSNTETKSMTAGFSRIGERGFFGIAVNRLENNYGLPPGAHEHHAHEDEEEPVEEEHHEDVRIDLLQTRTDLKGGLEMDGFFESLRTRLSFTDYEHTELEGDDMGTVFSNEGYEGRLTLNHRQIGSLSGVFGVQFADSKFGAVGNEAFIPVSKIRSAGLFVIESIDADSLTHEFGLRMEKHDVKPDASCKSGESTWSGSAATIWRFREDSNLFVSLNRSERAPGVEELYSNIESESCAEPADPEDLVEHLASARYEIGNPDLNTEISLNIELGLRRHLGDVRGEFHVFQNRIGDFIYLADTGLEFEETIISRYLQQDATFTGLEAELTFPFWHNGAAHLDLTLFGDYVRAKLNDGGNVPRIPALHIGAELAFHQERWTTKLRVTNVGDQEKIAENETETHGYTWVDLYFDYHLPLASDQRELVFFIKGNNLTDEEIRNHTSLLKNFAPEPGRGIEAGLRVHF
jgi:iron complex outermembrane receptor protein